VSESFLDGKVTLHRGNCLEVLPLLEESSIDSCVTDPPYHLTSIVKRFGSTNAAPCQHGTDGAYARASKGFMGKQWDGGDVAFRPETWAEVLRVLKPGAHLIAFSGTRTYHRMACAIEDAGFEIRDQIGWCYGSGFPKSHDVSKGIDRLAGAERERVATGNPVKRIIPGADQNKHGWEKNNGREYIPGVEIPATESAIQWQGWGSALKPAWEPIVLARKPLSESSIAANVLKHGTGGINVDGCRIASDGGHKRAFQPTNNGRSIYGEQTGFQPTNAEGRWPANLIHDGSDEVLAGFPESNSIASFRGDHADIRGDNYNRTEGRRIEGSNSFRGHTDSGSAARFFYTAKADADDRLGSKHPTVKPLDLIQYLIRLITPKGGVVLDPFAGTGTTGEAAFREASRAILVEREEEYQEDIIKRMGLCLSGPEERRAASVKQLPPDDLPMFGGGI
jgi:DNA modification methylase